MHVSMRCVHTRTDFAGLPHEEPPCAGSREESCAPVAITPSPPRALRSADASSATIAGRRRRRRAVKSDTQAAVTATAPLNPNKQQHPSPQPHTPPPAPSASPPIVFEEREWGWQEGASSGSGTHASNASTTAPSTGGSSSTSTTSRQRGGSSSTRARLGAKVAAAGATGGSGRLAGKQRSLQERCGEVETFWCTLRREQQLALLRVPLAPVLQRALTLQHCSLLHYAYAYSHCKPMPPTTLCRALRLF